MVEFAYVQCGLSIDEFYNLSFYEWNLEVQRVHKRLKDGHSKWEGQASLIREFMALMANINRNAKKQPVPFTGSDFIKLSFDKKDDQPKLLTQEEVENRVSKIEKIKHKLVKKKNGVSKSDSGIIGIS